MSSKNPHDRESDGGPAFPIQCHDRVEDWEGMSLRDWFAGQALISLVQQMPKEKVTPQEYSILVGRAAYAAADALLKERSK